MKATVLLIINDLGVRDSLGQSLRSEGCAVTFAANGHEALGALRTTGFDLVLLDLDLPTRDGWDTLGQIITTSLAIPLITITGRQKEERPAMPKGVFAVLEKTLEVPLLLDAMESALAKKSESRVQNARLESP